MTQELFGKGRTVLDQVLAVVENQQHAPAAQHVEQGVEQRPLRLLVHVEHAGYRAHDQERVGHWREFDEVDAVGEVGTNTVSDLQRHARLADATNADQGQQVGSGQQRQHRGQVILAADQRRLVGGQAVVRGIRRDNRGRMLIERQREAVATPRNRCQCLRAEQFAQTRDMLTQVVFLDHEVRPDTGQQLDVRHHACALGNQHQQQVEGACADRQWPAFDQQQTLCRAQFDMPEAVCLWSGGVR